MLYYPSKIQKTHADLAHLVERNLAKVEVAGSSPVIRSSNKMKGEKNSPFFLFSKREIRGSKEEAVNDSLNGKIHIWIAEPTVTEARRAQDRAP